MYSIAAIHELLCRSALFASIDLAAYMRQLVPDLIHFYGVHERIEVKVEGDVVTLELQRPLPYGLLLNELVSNACKHAFPLLRVADTGSRSIRVPARRSRCR